jgi:predicted dehydrogenase
VSPLRIAIVGCGQVVRLAHLRVLQEHPDVTVVAIADRDPEARVFCDRHAPAVRFFGECDELLHQVELDAVLIALPTLMHRDAAVAAFGKGLHVYLEKPIAATIADGEAVVAAWHRAGTVGTIGFNCRFNALYREMRDAIAAGEIGTPIAIRASWTANWPALATWRLSPASGGGALLELASHQVDLCRFLLSTEISKASGTTWSNRQVDEAAMLTLSLANGTHAQLFASYGSVEEDRWEVYGDKGKLVVDRYSSLQVERVPSVAAGGLASSVRRTMNEIAHLAYGLEKRRTPGHEPSYAASLAAFVEAARRRQQGTPSLDDGLVALRAIVAARETSESGSP